MKTADYEKIIQERDIQPTAIRILILKAMIEHPQAFSMADLEYKLETVDKSTLSRTIHLFLKKHLIHSIDDGSGSMKYSVCNSDCTCSLNDLHVHFFCNCCKKTCCMESISVPKVQLPKNFILENVNFVLKGICDKCSNDATLLHS
ncbi:MAG: transcriptional repressor [Bacteroidales bacterium]|jgi:Fur family ferric uptake transcriptional regulator|nr:transcriptional repressor [Bacteroidales bacterium]